MAKHQNFHLIGVRKGEQTKQTHRKELQSQHDQAHAADGNSNQKHHRRDERDDDPHQK